MLVQCEDMITIQSFITYMYKTNLSSENGLIKLAHVWHVGPEYGPFHTRKLRRRNSRNFGTFQVWKR